MSKLWTHSSVLLAIFLFGLVVGRSGLVPAPVQAAWDLEGGDPSGFYWNETDDFLDLFNFSPDETYVVFAGLSSEEAWQALGGETNILHVDGSTSIKTKDILDLTVYRLEGVATKQGPELIRPCAAPPIDCPAPGRPPVPPIQKVIVFQDMQEWTPDQ